MNNCPNKKKHRRTALARAREQRTAKLKMEIIDGGFASWEDFES